MATSHLGEPGGAGDPYHSIARAKGGVLPPVEAGAAGGIAGGTATQTSSSGGLLGALLDIVGDEHGSLQGTLAAWQREQDRLANRAWRRPGGMARPAGL
ncbi:MAG TPA: hypothetical protein VFN11_04115 [Ktedonobacterales bacterium]|nr:hypothetical protein [Ktedonobacterales bacterium]